MLAVAIVAALAGGFLNGLTAVLQQGPPSG